MFPLIINTRWFRRGLGTSPQQVPSHHLNHWWLSLLKFIYVSTDPNELYSALPISRGHFSPSNSQKTAIAHPLGWYMDVFLEFEVWPKFNTRIYWIVCNIVLYDTAIYQDSIVKRKTPRGWIQIGEFRWEVARESRKGFSPSGILATPRVRDSPIWIQSRGVFRFNPTPGS